VIEGTFWSDLIQMKEWKSTFAIAVFRIQDASQCSARAWPSGPPLTAVVAPATLGTCNVCKRGIPQGEAFWECSPCNWLACDQCNPLAVAAERAEAEEADRSPEEWRRMVEVWRGRKRRRHSGQAAGKRLVSGRLDEQVQVTPEGRRKHHFKHTSPGGTIRSDEYFSPPGPSGD